MVLTKKKYILPKYMLRALNWYAIHCHRLRGCGDIWFWVFILIFGVKWTSENRCKYHVLLPGVLSSKVVFVLMTSKSVWNTVLFEFWKSANGECEILIILEIAKFWLFSKNVQKACNTQDASQVTENYNFNGNLLVFEASKLLSGKNFDNCPVHLQFSMIKEYP